MATSLTSDDAPLQLDGGDNEKNITILNRKCKQRQTGAFVNESYQTRFDENFGVCASEETPANHFVEMFEISLL